MAQFIKVKFSDVPVGAFFYDATHSGEWMRKESDKLARWKDGLVTEFYPSDIVECVK